MGRDTEDAASRLHLLATHYREHPQTGPSERCSPSVTPGAPLNLGIVDYMSRCVDEVVQHARDEAAGDIGPLPARVRDVYAWWEEQTEDAPAEVRQRRDIVIYRQSLEHAIALGDHDVVCAHPCPRCTTWGLQWQPYTRRAMCLNIDCRGRDGMSSAWTLARLATQYVTQKEILKIRAT
jgi:hypothetical protein